MIIEAALRDSLVYGVASIFSKAMSVLLVPLYTRVLSPGDFGAYDLFMTLGALVNLVVALEISQGLARSWADTSEGEARRRLASTSLWFSVLMYGMFLMAGLLGADALNQFVTGDEQYVDAMRWGIGFMAANGIWLLVLNQFRWELRSKAHAGISIAYAGITLLLALVFCYGLQLGLVGVLIAQWLAACLSCFLGLWLLRGTFRLAFDPGQLRAMLQFSLPLVPAGVAVFVSLYFNRLALNHFGTLTDVGHFGIGNRIAGLVTLLIMGIQAALTPLVYQHHQDPQTPGQLARLFGWFTGLALVGCLFLSLFARELVWLFATPAFMPGAALVGVLAPAALLSQLYVFAPGMAIARKSTWQLGVTLLSALVCVACNWWLVPIRGVQGAALATLASSLVFFGCWLALSQRLYRIPYAWRPLLTTVAVFSIFVLAGQRLDQTDLAAGFAGGLKIVLMLLLALTVRATGLVSVQDLYGLRARLRRFKG